MTSPEMISSISVVTSSTDADQHGSKSIISAHLEMYFSMRIADIMTGDFSRDIISERGGGSMISSVPSSENSSATANSSTTCSKIYFV